MPQAVPQTPPDRNIAAVIVPAESGDPNPTISAIDTALSDLPGEHTIIVVSPESAPAASSTDTPKHIWEQHPGLRPLRCQAGWKLALQLPCDLILTADNLWQPTTEELKRFVELYESGARVVTGSRPIGSRGESARRLATKVTSRSKLQDPATPIRLYDHNALANILKNLPSTNSQHLEISLATLEQKSGFARKEIPLQNYLQ